MNRTAWALILGLSVGLTITALTHAADKPLDFDAEAKQAAQEDADQMAEREKGIRGKYQRTFLGTFSGISDPSQNASKKLSPDVIGTFATNSNDPKPGREYLVKVENGNKSVLELLTRLDGKNLQVTGKLRVLSPDGSGKYLVVSSVVEIAPTPPPVEHRKNGGL